MITTTYDPEQWQLVPRSSTLEMDRELVWGGDSGEEKWTAALATAPQHESQWQPIETAPKDCNIILFGRWWSDEQGWMKEPVIGRWNQKTDGRWEFANAGGWWGIRPTVWTPLPQHPDTGETTDRAHFGASAISSPEYLAAQNAANNRLREMMEKANTLSELPYRKMEHIRDNGDGTLTINRPIPYKSQGDAFAGERERCALIADAESAKMKITRVCEHPRTSIVWDEAYRRCDDCNASVPAEG